MAFRIGSRRSRRTGQGWGSGSAPAVVATYPSSGGNPAVGWNATHESVLGAPITHTSPTLGSSPARRIYAAGDRSSWGNNHGNVISDAAGLTVLVAIGPVAGDITADVRRIFIKDDINSIRTIHIGMELGKPLLAVFLVGGGSDIYRAASAVTAGYHRFTVRYNRSLARASRASFFLNGAAFAQDGAAYSTAGADGLIAETTTPLIIGQDVSNLRPGIGSIGSVYVWPGPLTDEQVISNDTWVRDNGWV